MNNRLNLCAVLVMIVCLVTACGTNAKKNETKASPTTPATVAATQTSTQAASGAETLEGRPTYATGSCSGAKGCITGYISHGLALTLTPDGGTETDARGEKLALSPYRFKDAQDFGDRFDSAFLKPLVPEDKLDQYDFRIAPTVKRDNFAAGFELYSEGAQANDDKVMMEAEGNFSIGDLAPFDQTVLRAVKTFRIEITRKAEADDGTPEIKRAVTCLEIDATLEALSVVSGQATSVGGLRNFRFYYTEDDSLCTLDLVGEGQARDIDAKSLPPVGPDLP